MLVLYEYQHSIILLCAVLIFYLIIYHERNLETNSYYTESEKSEKIAAYVDGAAKEHHRVLLGVLSKRSHFSQRQIIRQGLGKQLPDNNSFVWKFIVAKKPCFVPEEDRKVIYRCEPQSYLYPSADIFYSHRLSGETTKDTNMTTISYKRSYAFDFVVNEDIVVSQLGFYDHNSDGFKHNLKVTLHETTKMKEIISATFFPSGQTDHVLYGDHGYKNITPTTMRKGFRGTISVDGANENDPLVKTKRCMIDDGQGLITHLSDYRIGSTPNCPIVGPSFSYYPRDNPQESATVLSEKRNRRYYDLEKEIRLEELQLQEEASNEGDLLFIDIVESYRNLPQNMLLFHEWATNQSFDYVMKSDDDTFLNVTRILNFLDQVELKENVWIGNFKSNFPIRRSGKWEEHDYIADSWPQFAGGGSYLLSRDLVSWLAMNRKFLKCYQGEDVSLGIWLAAINPIKVKENLFGCIPLSKVGNMFSSPDNDEHRLKYFYGV